MNPEIPQQIEAPQQEYMQPDMTEYYGSIIKDLTDTQELIKDFKFRLLGYKEINGEVYKVKDVLVDEESVEELVSLIESIVNQNTHFSYYDKKTISNILQAANYHINRFLMFQGDRVPLRMRANISTEAMCLITASLHKASDGNILRWTKGQISESRVQNPDRKNSNGFFNIFGRNR